MDSPNETRIYYWSDRSWGISVITAEGFAMRHAKERKLWTAIEATSIKQARLNAGRCGK